MSLKKTTFSATRWTAASTGLVAGVQILQTSVLARFLSPSEFGLMAVATAMIAVLSLLVDWGLSQALIHFDDVPTRHRSSIYWLNMLLSFFLMTALCLAAPIIARLYQSILLEPLLCWASLVFPLSAVGQQLRALAAKELRFDTLALIEVISAIASCVFAVVAALFNAGLYSLIIAFLTNAGLNSLLSWIMLPPGYRPMFHFNATETRTYLRFGSYLVGESIAGSFHRNADVFVGGLALGASTIGIYSVPRDLSLRLATTINSIGTRIGFPVMSQVKHSSEKLKSIYLQTLRMTASINFPAYIVLGVFANDIVALLYGSKWHSSVIYLQILAVWGLVRSTGSPIGSLIYATGKTKRAFWWNMSLLLILPLLFWLGTKSYDLLGLALTAIVIQLFLFIPIWILFVRPCCRATLREYTKSFLAPLFCALIAGFLAWLPTHDLPHSTVRLAVGGIVLGVAYLLLSWCLNRQWVIAILELLNIRKI